jgi:cell wall-associated NlpC family hydrolase
MASKRKAAGLVFSISALLACTCASLSARPLLPPDPPALNTELAPLTLTLSPDRLDAVAAGAEASTSLTDAVKAGADAPHPRRALADFAMKLRNIAYRRGGRDLGTGFDCSGFVRYVFTHALGLEVASDSASQFNEGQHVDRDDLKMGDLVFFRTHGKRISHVGIYLDNGLFIHAPSTGKRVRIDHLAGSYWSKRYVGAKRPDAFALDASPKLASAVSG